MLNALVEAAQILPEAKGRHDAARVHRVSSAAPLAAARAQQADGAAHRATLGCIADDVEPGRMRPSVRACRQSAGPTAATSGSTIAGMRRCRSVRR